MIRTHKISFIGPNHLFFDLKQFDLGEGLSIELPCNCAVEKRGFNEFEQEISLLISDSEIYLFYESLLTCGNQFGLKIISEVSGIDKQPMREILVKGLKHRILRKISSQYKVYDKDIKDAIQQRISSREMLRQHNQIVEEKEEQPGIGLFRKLSEEKDRQLTKPILKAPRIVRRHKKR